MEYFIIENGKQVGPFAADELVYTRNITSESLVWNENMSDWTPAWQVAELRDMMERRDQHANPQTTNANPQTETAAQQGYQPQQNPQGYQNQQGYQSQQAQQQAYQPQQPAYQQPAPKKSNTAKIVAIVAVVALFVVMMISNPSKQAHKDAIKGVLTEAVDKASKDAMGGNDLLSMGIGLLNQMFTGDVVETALNQLLDVDNYLIFSRGEVHFGGKSHAVTFGFLGHVYTMNADDVLKAFQENGGKIEMKEEQVEEPAEEQNNDEANVEEEQSTEDMLNDAAGNFVNKVTKKAKDKVNKKIKEKLDEAADSTDSFLDKIFKALGL